MRPRKIRFHQDAPDAYRQVYTERFALPSVWWLRREKDEQEKRVENPRT